MAGSVPSKVAIFWDYENCHPPSGSSGSKLVDNIRRLAQAHGHIRVFKAYADLSLDLPEQHSPGLLYELQLSGVTLVHCPHNGMKEAADKMMIVDMLVFALDNHVSGTMVIITSDRDFAYAAATMKLRGWQIMVFTRDVEFATSKMRADYVFDWKAILVDTLAPEVTQTGSGCPMVPRASTGSAKPTGPSTAKQESLSTTTRGKDKSSLSSGNAIKVITSRSNGQKGASESIPSRLADVPPTKSCKPVGPPSISSVCRFRMLVEYFYEQKQLTGSTQTNASIVAAALRKRDPGVYKKAAVKGMKQYVEEARRAKVIVSASMNGHGHCLIEISSNIPAFVTLYKRHANTNSLSKSTKASQFSPSKRTGVLSHLFGPLIDLLREEHPTYELSDNTLGPFFRRVHPNIYKLAKVNSLSSYLQKALEQGVVYFPVPSSLGRQCVRLVRSLRRK